MVPPLVTFLEAARGVNLTSVDLTTWVNLRVHPAASVLTSSRQTCIPTAGAKRACDAAGCGLGLVHRPSHRRRAGHRNRHRRPGLAPILRANLPQDARGRWHGTLPGMPRSFAHHACTTHYTGHTLRCATLDTHITPCICSGTTSSTSTRASCAASGAEPRAAAQGSG